MKLKPILKAERTISTDADKRHYIGKRFDHSGKVFEIWRYNAGHQSYDAVAVVDVQLPITTVQYGMVSRDNTQYPVHRLLNIDNNTFVNIPAEMVPEVFTNPQCLTLR